MKKKLLLFLAFTLLTFFMMTRIVRAQFALGVQAGISNPMRGTFDSLPGLRTSFAVLLQPSYTAGRIKVSGTIGYQQLNTAGGFTALAKQYGYTSDKGFSLRARSGGYTVLALAIGADLLRPGVTDCGLPKPSLFVSAGAGMLLTTSKVDGEVLSKGGDAVFALQQTSSSAVPYYLLRAEMLYPLSHNVSLVTGVNWNKSMQDLSFQHSANGTTSTSRVGYSDVQLSVGVQISFGSQARPGAPIKGLILKGHRSELTEANPPIPGVDAADDAAARPGAPIRPIIKGHRSDMTEGNPIPGVEVAGGKPHSLVYEKPLTVKNNPLLTNLGLRKLVIAAGEYPIDYSNPGEARVILHLHKENIVHRDIAARNFVSEGTDANGQPYTYTVEPLFEKGVAKDIIVTYKGISEKGVK